MHLDSFLMVRLFNKIGTVAVEETENVKMYEKLVKQEKMGERINKICSIAAEIAVCKSHHALSNAVNRLFLVFAHFESATVLNLDKNDFLANTLSH